MLEGDILLDNIIGLLCQLEYGGDSEDTNADHFDLYNREVQSKLTPKSWKREAEEAWKSVLRSDLARSQRKQVLASLSAGMMRWFTQPEVVMDFLTDSFDAGGSASLTALSGIFFLIQERNLDYPYFYRKVYSLLDRNCLHSKRQTRFLHLLETFLTSTHLPAVLVASFIKRLSRLCLHSTPQGIIAIIPWIYNLIILHPSCTFLIHRTQPAGIDAIKDSLKQDPFAFDEKDPVMTNAIQSSLWEIETLQGHFDPHVTTIARIISEQFTKPSYRLEDFCQHNFQTVR